MRIATALVALAAFNVAVWAPVWWMVTTPARTTPVATPRSAERPMAGLEALPAAGQVLDLGAIAPVHSYSRPLFARERRPWQPPPPPPEPQPAEPVAAAPRPPPPPPPALRLVGVSASDGGAARALVRREVETEPVWVAEGEEFAGWTVSRIDHQSILFERGRRSFSVDLYPDGRAGQ